MIILKIKIFKINMIMKIIIIIIFNKKQIKKKKLINN